jgi:alanyl-tRNA synthetase
MMTSAEIRKAFLDFFKSKGHEIVPSASIVIKNDPSLLFTNAGMNQFKDYFLGNKRAPYSRAADTQKCLRVSGKHNDLEEVGVDTYHHTMFEMLGNWSFGSAERSSAEYFKTEAVAWSWELLTEIYKIPRDQLYVTVFEGDARENLPADEETALEWKKWIDESRIIFGNKKDNFWEMGDTGPCGPCTEIHVDCRSLDERNQVDGKELVNKDHPQVIEVWNNVFIQFNRLKDGSLEMLPSRHVDTGMGLERLVRVLQQKPSNYDTDLFSGTIGATEKITGKSYFAFSTKPDIAFRVIADHIRAIAFTIADGQLPSNTGAGYVIRRILRRAVRYYYSYLDYKQPLLYHLIPVLAEQFKNVFPELFQQSDFVLKVIKEEEEAFLRTLDKGLKKIDEIITDVSSSPSPTINGKAAFELYDTFGFPIDLTRLIAREHNLEIDESAFESEMKQQKDRSRAAGATDTEDWVIVHDNGAPKFLGYETLETKSRITRYRKISARGKDSYQLVLDVTPFYAESGGQVGDTGKLISGEQEIHVTDTKKENELILHYTDSLPTDLSGELLARVDMSIRKQTEVHHSATHLLHAALRKVLGEHVTQKGSLVGGKQLRFDFSHFSKVTDEELLLVEKTVNAKIREDVPVLIDEMQKEEAVAKGAMALFGEKYGNLVRVVTMDPAYSVELCGGTHVSSTGQLGYFKIKHETAVAAGVRRIEAVSGSAAEQYIDEQLFQLQQIRQHLNAPKDLLRSVESLLAENSSLKKRLESQDAKQTAGLKKQLLDKVQQVNGLNFIGELLEVSSPETLKKLCFDLKADLQNYVIILAANVDGKASVALAIEEGVSAAKRLEAPKIIKEQIAPLIKGGGGGQKTLATAGGQDTTQLKEVIERVRGML